MKKVVYLLALTVVISQSWELFHNWSPKVVKFWSDLGLDVTKKYDLFPFTEHQQYLHWYAQYTNYLLSIVILSYIIFTLVKHITYKPVVIASKIILIFSIFRLISYWLFRGSIEFELLCTALTMFVILITIKWRQFSS